MFCTEQTDVRGFCDGSFGTCMYNAGHECVAGASGIHHMAREGGKMMFGVTFDDIQTLCSEANKSPIHTLQVGKSFIFDLIAF